MTATNDQLALKLTVSVVLATLGSLACAVLRAWVPVRLATLGPQASA